MLYNIVIKSIISIIYMFYLVIKNPFWESFMSSFMRGKYNLKIYLNAIQIWK